MNDSVGQSTVEPVSDGEISLLDLAIVLAKRKRWVLVPPFVSAVISVIYALSLVNIYTATTKVLPPQQGLSSASGMLAQLGGIAGLAGGALGAKGPNEIYVGMLTSRTVADNMIQRFDLMSYYGAKYPSDARRSLGSSTKVAAGKEGIITIEVDDRDPKRAADMANGYVDELMKLTRVLAVTEASKRRLFFEQQFSQAKDNLAKAEIAAKQAIDKGGLANIDAQGRTLLETTARLRAQISVKEVQIGAMRSYAAEHNPELIKAQHELVVFRSELARIEGNGERHDTLGGSDAGFDNQRLLRDVKYFEVIYELLAKQFELAKIDEAKDAALVQVLDRAVEPDRKSKPQRAKLVLGAVLVALFFGILWAFILESLEKSRQDPESVRRLTALREYLLPRRRGKTG